MIIVIGDLNSRSAQAVRYKCLFDSLCSIEPNYLITFSSCNLELQQWKAFNVSKPLSELISRITSGISRRLSYPDSYMFKMYKYKSFMLSQEELLFEKSITIGCAPFSLMLLAPWIKKHNSKTNLIMDMSDPFSFNMCNVNSTIRKAIARRIERFSFPHFDHIVVLNESIRNKYQESYPEFVNKFKVIEQGVDEDFIKKVEDELNHNDKRENCMFMYAGGFYKKGRNPHELYRAFDKLNHECMLSIYGNIRRNLRPKGIDNIIFHKAIDKERLAHLTARADALVLMDNEYGYQVPGKTLETLASGKPVLFIYSNEDSPTLKYVRKAKGVIWAKNSVEGIAQGIKKIVKGDYETPYFDYSPYTWERMRAKFQAILR